MKPIQIIYFGIMALTYLISFGIVLPTIMNSTLPIGAIYMAVVAYIGIFLFILFKFVEGIQNGKRHRKSRNSNR
jgi:hypothetical protein